MLIVGVCGRRPPLSSSRASHFPATSARMHSKRSPLFSPIEILEPRVAPAGIIDIVTKDGSAFIKVFGNTDTAQDLTIAGSLNGTLFLFGNDNETFRLNGIAGNGPIQ